MEDFIVEAVESTRGPLAIQIKRTRSPPIRDAKVNGAEWQGRGRKLTAFPKRTRIKRTLLLCTKRSSVRNSINTVQVSRLRFPLPRRNLVSTHPSRHRWQIVSTTAYFEKPLPRGMKDSFLLAFKLNGSGGSCRCGSGERRVI